MNPKDERGTLESTLTLCKTLSGIPEYTLDVAASDELHVCKDYFTIRDNGLEKAWVGHVWCNPPYSDIEPWVRKAWAQIENYQSCSMLIPANRTEQPFWQNQIEPYRERHAYLGKTLRTYFLPKRQSFKGFEGRSPPFACVLLVWS